ncbi:hypothetical protein F511_14164 [Dorcoceras hygrometricum]|uniref:Uncharacterized protein n=1 Tax=Dorcoceras hygrometricum TaxID=472368 RepID=A0A2Z7D4S7_9LAMI|nr:hypothetical protein F511_14164 [Dorcoceras hygrometricum]
MASRYLQNCLLGTRRLIVGSNGVLQLHSRIVFYHSTEVEGEEISPLEWCDKAFLKLKKLSHTLKEVDLIGGRLVNINDDSIIIDEALERKMHAFKSIVRAFIGIPLMQETMRNNLVASFGNQDQYRTFPRFGKPCEREKLRVTSLTKVADILSISAQQRKLVRHTICPQVTQHRIWMGSLQEILNGLKSDIDVLIHCHRPSKEIRLAQQIVVGSLKFLQSFTSYDDPESTSWMRPRLIKQDVDSIESRKWEDLLEMSTDLINCLDDQKELAFHVSKLMVMKEGLYQIRDVVIDKNIGYKETRHQEYVAQKTLSRSLGHSSQCLFTLLLYYLYGSVKDIEVEVRGGVHTVDGSSNMCLYMGKILTSDEENVVWNGVKQLDKALGLFKFVWETAKMKGDLEVQGHLWCVGTENRSVSYRGIVYFIHGIHLR